MADSQMRVLYFNARGRAEITRLLFKLAGKEFVDDRIKEGTFAEVKPSTPLGQVPVFYHGDKTMVHSMAIARYVARELGLAGSTSWDQAVGDMMCETAVELIPAMMAIRYKAKTEEEKKEAMEKLEKVVDGAEKLIGMYKRGKFMLGDKPSLADAIVFNGSEMIGHVNPDFVAKRPNMKAISEAFKAIPAIAEWVKVRPESTF